MSPKNKSSVSTREERKARAKAIADASEATARRRRLLTRIGVVAAVVVVLGGLFAIYRFTSDASTETAGGGSGKYVYQVGKPGPGDKAIDFSLPSTKGGAMGVADFQGRTVLTYWHEGLGCQPCWDQIRSMEEDQGPLEAAGIDEFVSITSGPLDALKQKVADDQLDSVTLADTDLAVSKQYQMNQFGMMGRLSGRAQLHADRTGRENPMARRLRWRSELHHVRPRRHVAGAARGRPRVVTAGTTRVTLLTRIDCAFCDHAKAVLARVGEDYSLAVNEVSLDAEEGRRLATRHGVLFAPGILLDEQAFGYGRLSERRLRKELAHRALTQHGD